MLDELCPWFFIFDLINYARWLTIHIKDLVELSKKHLDRYVDFKKGNFVVQHSTHKFSLMAKDQSHEHSNRKLQDWNGGLADIYDDIDNIVLYMLATDRFEKVLDFHGP